MKLYPAIDLMNGKCVRLFQGRFDAVSQYDTDPLTVARAYTVSGAQWIHVVDLDGARGEASRQAGLLGEIARAVAPDSCRVQAGGGIRDESQVEKLLEAGVSRVVIGSLAIREPERFGAWLRRFGGESITLAVDVRWTSQGEPVPATAGWEKEGNRTLWEVLDGLADSPLEHVLCTDISRDGTLSGPHLDLYRTLAARYPGFSIQASGGIGELADLGRLVSTGARGAVIGKALYEGRFTFPEAKRLVEERSAC